MFKDRTKQFAIFKYQRPILAAHNQCSSWAFVLEKSIDQDFIQCSVFPTFISFFQKYLNFYKQSLNQPTQGQDQHTVFKYQIHYIIYLYYNIQDVS